MKYVNKITNGNKGIGVKSQMKSKAEDSVVTIDRHVVAEFVWFELKENAAETKLRKYP